MGIWFRSLCKRGAVTSSPAVSCGVQAAELALLLYIHSWLHDLLCGCAGGEPNSWISCFPTWCQFLYSLLLVP